MSRILVIAEHDGEQLNPSTAKSISCATAIGGDISVAIFAEQAQTVAQQAAAVAGVNQVLTLERAENRHPLAAVIAPQIVAMAESFSHILAPSTTFGKDLMPRVAALLGVAQVSDIMQVEGPYQFQRPIYAGNVIIAVQAPEDAVLVGTVRTASYPAAGSGGQANIESISTEVALPSHTRFEEVTSAAGERPDLQSAPRVVAGGRALGSADNFELIYRLADRLGAAVGASRAAVDAGYVANDLQVGQTGKIIAPDLYLAIGISGAIQHLTGIKDAGTIVAINKDADAAIFEVADFGLVGDLFELIPQLEQALG